MSFELIAQFFEEIHTALFNALYSFILLWELGLFHDFSDLGLCGLELL